MWAPGCLSQVLAWSLQVGKLLTSCWCPKHSCVSQCLLFSSLQPRPSLNLGLELPRTRNPSTWSHPPLPETLCKPWTMLVFTAIPWCSQATWQTRYCPFSYELIAFTFFFMLLLRQGLLYLNLVWNWVAGDALQFPTFLSLYLLRWDYRCWNGNQRLKQASFPPRP